MLIGQIVHEESGSAKRGPGIVSVRAEPGNVDLAEF
jgi:hypothetical protein